MNALKQHFVHHRRYMLGCLAGALLSIIGGLLHEPVLTLVGAVICGGFCLQTIRMMAFRPKSTKAAKLAGGQGWHARVFANVPRRLLGGTSPGCGRFVGGGCSS